MNRFSHGAAAALITLALGGCSQTSMSDGGVETSAAGGVASESNKAAELPKCAAPLAKVAIVDRPIAVLTEWGLTSPVPVVQAMISQSNCFQIVDNSPEMAAIAATKGKKGAKKLATPDYLISADIISQNPNSGAGQVATGFASLLPGYAGQAAGSLSVKTSEVRTALYLTQTDTGIQVANIQGYAQTVDLGASYSRWTKGVGVNIGVYADTPIGKTTAAALLDSYTKLVKHVQSMPKVASAR